MEAPAGLDRATDYWTLFPRLSSSSLTYSNLTAAIASGAALAAYFRGGDASTRDPAWLTSAALAGAPILFNLLILVRCRQQRVAVVWACADGKVDNEPCLRNTTLLLCCKCCSLPAGRGPPRRRPV